MNTTREDAVLADALFELMDARAQFDAVDAAAEREQDVSSLYEKSEARLDKAIARYGEAVRDTARCAATEDRLDRDDYI